MAVNTMHSIRTKKTVDGDRLEGSDSEHAKIRWVCFKVSDKVVLLNSSNPTNKHATVQALQHHSGSSPMHPVHGLQVYEWVPRVLHKDHYLHTATGSQVNTNRARTH